MRAVRVSAHAKINLSLRITAVRPDGYHDLRTVFQALALRDELTFAERPGPFEIECDNPSVPRDDRNLVWRAAALLWEAAGRSGKPDGVRVTIDKRIPVEAGLGGGSSNAAAALRGLASLWRLPIADEGLLPLAARIGADVPFFFTGGAALGIDRGDCLFPMVDLPRLEVVLVLPGFGVSTKAAYAWYDEDASSGLSVRTRQTPGRVPGSWARPAADVVNDLEEPVARRHPEIAEAAGILRQAGSEVAAMSGSGSAVFGLFTSSGAAGAAVRASERRGWRAVRTRTLGHAEYKWLSRVRRQRPAPTGPR